MATRKTISKKKRIDYIYPITNIIKAKDKNPSREEIAIATKEFLKKGGKITKLKPATRSYEDIIKNNYTTLEVDEYLRN